MEPRGVKLGHDIEQEGVCVVVESLVVQEQLGYQTEVLAVCLTDGRGD